MMVKIVWGIVALSLIAAQIIFPILPEIASFALLLPAFTILCRAISDTWPDSIIKGFTVTCFVLIPVHGELMATVLTIGLIAVILPFKILPLLKKKKISQATDGDSGVCWVLGEVEEGMFPVLEQRLCTRHGVGQYSIKIPQNHCKGFFAAIGMVKHFSPKEMANVKKSDLPRNLRKNYSEFLGGYRLYNPAGVQVGTIYIFTSGTQSIRIRADGGVPAAQVLSRVFYDPEVGCFATQ